MKILLVTNRMRPGHVGGMEDHTAVLAHSLTSIGVTVAVLTGKSSGDVFTDSRLAGLKVLQVADSDLPSFMRSAKFLAEFVNEDVFSADVIVCQSRAGIPLLERASDLPPIVTISHGNPLNEFESLARSLYALVKSRNFRMGVRWTRSVLQQFTMYSGERHYRLYRRGVLVVVNKDDSLRCRLLYRLSSSGIAVIENGVDRGSASNDRTKMSFDYTYVGRLTCDKAADRFLTALRHLDRDSSFHAAIAGSGYMAEYCLREFADLFESGKVEFMGDLTHDEVLELYSRSRVVVVPSRRRESMSLVYLEAVLSGCVVVAGDRAGMRGTRSFAQSGILVKGSRLQSWTRAMEVALAASKSPIPLVPSALVSSTRMAESYRDLFRRVLERQPNL